MGDKYVIYKGCKNCVDKMKVYVECRNGNWELPKCTLQLKTKIKCSKNHKKK